MAILIDFSQLVLGSCYAFSDELSASSENKEEARNIIRHIILSRLKYFNTKYKNQYGNMIICCDGKHYWRRNEFAPYKACRKKARAESSMDWKLIFNMMDEIIVDLKNNFPYKVIQLDDAESDDVIATLSKYFQENELTESSMLFVGDKQPILIVSSDKDFVQLQKYDNVTQISPKNKKPIKCSDPIMFLREKIIRGDRGDGIPNILSSDNTFVDESQRQSRLTKKDLQKYMAMTVEDYTENETIRKNWERNRLLIDFDYIPKDVENNILSQYHSPILGNKMKVFNYLIKYHCQNLLKNIEEFF